MQLRLLGAPQVTLDGLPVLESLPRKAQATLFYLAVTGQPQSRSTLAGLLWGDLSERAARSNLRKVLTNLRQTVGAYLNIDRHNVDLKAECDCWIDVAAFEASVGHTSSTIDTRQLQQAVDLYRGDFLTGFYVLHAPDFEAWMLAEQARLRELVVQALYTLAGSYPEPDELPRGITYARRLLALEPWREEAQRQLMLLLARDGQRSAALAQYDLCRQVLAEELGVEPTAETTVLYEQIREGALSGGAEARGHSGELISSAPPPPRSPAPPHNLPAQLTPLIGRETELTGLTQLLSDPDLRLVTILGPGGMGKTRLAAEVAQTLVTNFPDGVYFVPLASLTSPDSIVPTIAEVINFSFYDGGRPQQQLFDYLRQKQMLLVLDNFEHLLGGTGLIVELLRTAPGLKTLITSRAKLNIQGEQLFPIFGIEFPPEVETPEKAAEFSAVKLFLQSARRMQPGFDLKPDNVGHVNQICRWVEGMPLGILLAAAWLDVLSPAEIATEIGRSPDFLASDLRDLPERQQSLRAVFDHSWRLLAKQEQRIFQQLSIFRGGFNHQAAQAVAGASLRELRALVNKSMLSRTSSGRYEMHDLLQRYGLDKLAEDPTREATTRNRHSAYYGAFLQQRETDLKGSRQRTALAEIDADTENVRVAWDWAVEQGGVNRLAQALEALSLFYERRGRYQEGELACRLAVEKLQTVDSPDGQRLLARALTWQGNFNRELARTERASRLLKQALTLLDRPELAQQDIRLERAFILWRMGQIARRTDYQKAGRLFEQSLGLFQELDDPWWISRTLAALAHLAWDVGRYHEARQLSQESLVIVQRLGDQEVLADQLSMSGWIALSLGQFEQARQYHQESLAIFRKLASPERIATLLRSLATAHLFLGRFDRAHALLEESVSLHQKLGGGGGNIIYSTVLFGAAKAQLGQYDQARTQEQSALSLGREFGDRAGVGHALLWLGRVALAEKAYDEARQLLQEATAIFHELKKQEQVADAAISLGYAIYALGETAAAQQFLATGLQTASKIGAFLPLLFAIPLASLLSVDRGNTEKALEIYACASKFPFVATSRWFEDVVGRSVAAAAANLPPEAVATAHEQGQARDMWETAAELTVTKYFTK